MEQSPGRSPRGARCVRGARKGLARPLRRGLLGRQGGHRRLRRLADARSRARERIFALLADAPRDWSHGVPCMWVAESLSYEDAFRPLAESLAETPPIAYGYREALS